MNRKCFIFDMDGVITSSSDEHFAAWKQLAQELGGELSEEVEVYTRGVSRMKSLEIVLENIGMQNDFTEDEKLQMAVKKNENYVSLISDFTRDDLYDGMIELLEEIRSRGYKIALGSASKNGPLLLDKMGITEYFDYIVDPSSVKNGKPAPDIFLKAAEVLGFDICDCIGIEDAVAGVEAIKSAGMYAVGIGEKNVLDKADIVYKEVKNIKIDDFI